MIDFKTLYEIGLSCTQLFIVMIGFILTDTILGVSRAKLVNNNFSSGKLRDGYDKWIQYFSVIFITLLLTWWLPSILVWHIDKIDKTYNLVQIMMIGIILVEGCSIVENIKDIPILYNILSSILNRIKILFGLDKYEEETEEQLSIEDLDI